MGWFVLAVAVFAALFFVAAPYGRYFRKSWGPAINNQMGWAIMEAAAPVVFGVCFFAGKNADTIPMLVFFGLWQGHYLYRAFIYPLGLRGNNRMPLAIVSFGLLFNMVNGYLNGRYLFTFSSGYTNEWLWDPRFIFGLALFLVGCIINRHADQTLQHLRQSGESGYKIPSGGLYHWISCPNYLGEIIIWLGWASATWSLSGLAFAVWTAANLVPRARSHHEWYQKSFPGYPPGRRALLPGLW